MGTMKNVLPLLFVALFACGGPESVTATPVGDDGSSSNDAFTQDGSQALPESGLVGDSGQAGADASEGGSGAKDSGTGDAGRAQDAGNRDAGRDASRDAAGDSGETEDAGDCDSWHRVCYRACETECEDDVCDKACHTDCDQKTEECKRRHDAGCRH